MEVPLEHHKQQFFEECREFVELKPSVELTTIGDFQEIDDFDDEIWLMQCPKGTDIAQMQGEKIKLPGRSSVNELELLAVELAETQQQAFGYCNRKGRYALRLLPLRGSIVLRSRLKANDSITAEKIEESCPAMARVAMPEYIKVRHPLLGVKFEDRLVIDKAIAKRLKQADETSSQIMSETRLRARKSGISSRQPIEIESGDDEDVEFVSETKGKKKKKKRKNSERTEDEETPSKKKSKKSKKSSVEDVSDDLQWLKKL